MYTFIIIHIHPFIDPSIHPCKHNTYTNVYHSWRERVHALLLWWSRSFTTETDRGSLPVSLSSFENRLMICVKSSMMKESLRCDRSGDLQDPLFFFAFCCRVSLRSLLDLRVFKDLRPNSLVEGVLPDLLCELHTSKATLLSPAFPCVDLYHITRQKWCHTSLTVSLLITTWDRHRGRFNRPTSMC